LIFNKKPGILLSHSEVLLKDEAEMTLPIPGLRLFVRAAKCLSKLPAWVLFGLMLMATTATVVAAFIPYELCCGEGSIALLDTIVIYAISLKRAALAEAHKAKAEGQ
jgi:hypothetical protein